MAMTTTWEVPLLHRLITNQILLRILVRSSSNICQSMHLFKLTNFTHSIGLFERTSFRILTQETCWRLFKTVVGYRVVVRIIVDSLFVGVFVEIISCIRTRYTVVELLGRCDSSGWLALLHVLEALPDLLAFETCAIEDLVGYGVIRHYRFGFVSHFCFR